ncbi:MAG: GLUG motif-containing protein, partial [Sedimentisphaerales bacterium]
VGRYFGGTIVNCYSTGDVSGNFQVGGLVGDCRDGTITNCYSTGAVTGTLEVGGLVGSNSTGTVTACFWDRQRSGLSNMCGEQDSGTGCDDANGKTTAQMQTADMFLEAGWDFVRENDNGTEDIWTICEGSNYPQFAWQFIMGDFDGDFRVDFVDFAFFAQRWLVSDMSFVPCRGADLTGDSEVGFDDLREFADNWLTEGIPSPTAVACLVIDDFESYNDLDPSDPASNRIFDVWLDGYDNPLVNGCTVGHLTPPFAERDVVYEGEQSMPFYYNALFKVGTAERTLSPPQNWAETGAEVLSLWFHGDRLNGVTPMSVVLNGEARVYHNGPEATRINAWTEWIIDLKAFTDVDLTSVCSIAICLGDPSKLQAGGTGLMFFDSIRLYGPG